MKAPRTRSIHPAELGRLHRENGSGKLAILDVRTPAEHREVHVEGSVLIPLDSLDGEAVARLKESPEPLYVLCRSGSRACKAVEKLGEAGVPQPVVVEGGLLAWEEEGLPVVRGARKTISLERQVRIAAGALVAAGSLLAWLVSPAWLALPAFVGAGLVFAGITDTCGMGMLLARMPWNR